MIVEGRLNRHEMEAAASALYELCHAFGTGDVNGISFEKWREQFAPRKRRDAARREWERLKQDFEVMGAPVRRERDGKAVLLVLLRGTLEFALGVLRGLTKYDNVDGGEAVAKGSRFIEIDIDDITPPEGWEPDPIELEAMKESLRTCPIGLIHPIVVVGEAPPFELGLGRKRWAASKALGERKILARVVKTWDPLIALDENLVRSHYSEREVENVRQVRDRLIAEKKAQGKSNVQVASELGVSEATVRRRSLSSGDESEQPGKVATSDGKTYPARVKREEVADRRAQVRALKADGLSTRKIAKQLDISVGAVQKALATDEPEEVSAPVPPARQRAWTEIDPAKGEPPWLCIAAMEDGLYRALDEPEGTDLRPYVVGLDKLFAGIARRIRDGDFKHKPPPPLRLPESA